MPAELEQETLGESQEFEPATPAAETPPEDGAEYVKPNPAANPRNQILGEIAKTVAKQHEADAAETTASIDDDGNITPAPEPKKAEPAQAQPATTSSPSAEPASPAPAAAATPTGPIDPTKEYELTVEGQKINVLGAKLIESGVRTFQKETAADYKLKMASELLREAEDKVRQQSPAPQAQPQPKADEPGDADLAQAIQYGTPDQASAAIAKLRNRGVASPEQIQGFVVSQTRAAARDEFAFQDGLTFVKTEYGDLLANDYLKRLFFIEENRYRAPKERGGMGDARPYREVYKEIGDNLRKAFGTQQAQAAPATTPSTTAETATASGRQALKARTPTPPKTAASRLQESAAPKAKTTAEIIAGMAANRGKDRLTQARKG